MVEVSLLLLLSLLLFMVDMLEFDLVLFGLVVKSESLVMSNSDE